MSSNDLGVIGMAVMGRNLALNAASKGFMVAVYNRTWARTQDALKQAEQEHQRLDAHRTLADFVNSLAKPRKIILLIKAGPAVECTLNELLQLVSEGDIIIDGGNEHFKNTDARTKLANDRNVRYMGMGISGGEEGARHGPSLMPGGDESIYRDLEPILTKIAAQVDGKPCVAFLGNGSAGNYVKMVHNGIEYGDMELIAETYHLLRNLYRLDNIKIAQIFNEWNSSRELDSFLIEISALVCKTPDPEDKEKQLLDAVLDVAGSKGTGKWTVQEAADKGVPIPTIQAALDSRYLSAFTNMREDAKKIYGAADHHQDHEHDADYADLKSALYCSKICSYAQGLMLLMEASKVEGFNLHVDKIAAIWTGGCIIRARFLQDITKAYERNKELSNLLFDKEFSERIKHHEPGWRRVVCKAIASGIPAPALSASLNYFDALRAQRLPLNLVQAQRDHFGSHTFKRCDKEGVFHANWKNGEYIAIE